jgi:hypothetical protein
MSQGGFVDITQSNPSVAKEFQTDSQNAIPIAGVLQVVGGEGIDTSGSTNIVTISGELATAAGTVGTANIGMCAFDSANFTVTDGFVALVGGGYGIVNLLSNDGSPAVIPNGSGQVEILGANGIVTSGQSPSNIIAVTGVQATAAQIGVLKLATSADSIAGTEATKAITPSTLTSKLGTQTSNGMAYGQGTTGAIGYTSALNSGYLVIGSFGAPPVAASITTGDGISSALGPGSLSIFGLQSTPTTLGVVELATVAETIAGTDSIRSITPSGLTGKLGTQTSNGLAYGQGTTSAIGYTSALTDGQLIIGSTGLAPVTASLTAGTGINVVNAAGSITISALNNGDVVGPASATDNAIARFDGVTGKLIQNSSIIIDDTDNMTGVTSMTIDGATGGTLVVDTDVLYVDATNNRVGAGTATPGSPLHVYESNTTIIGTTTLGLTIQQASTGDAGLQLAVPGRRWVIGVDNSTTNDSLVFFDDSISQMVVTIDSIAEQFQLNDTGTNSWIGLHGPGGSPFTGRIEGASATPVTYTFIEFLLSTGGAFTEGKNIFFNTTNVLRMTLDDAGLYVKPASSSTFPTAYLHLGIGTATASTAPLKFTSGTNLTTPEAGAVEYDGSYFYSTNSSTVRRTIDSYIYTEVTGTSASMVVNSVYTSNNAGLVTLTLPATAALGDTIQVDGKGAGGWQVAQNAGQTIHYASSSTTTGITGYIASTVQYQAVKLRCITANTNFVVESTSSTLSVV